MFQEVVLIVLVKLLLAINVDRVVCSRLQKFGGNGTRKSISAKSRIPVKDLENHLLMCNKALRYSLCSRSFLRSLSTSCPRPPYLHCFRSPSRHLLKSVRRCRSRQDFCCCRSSQSGRRWTRRRQGTKIPQASRWQGQDEGSSLSSTPRPTRRLQS